MKKLIILFIFLLGLIGSYRLMRPGYFSMQDDMHVFRLQQLDKCFHDGQIPCRYVPDAGMGYSYPLFNFYSPLPYIIGEIFHLVGFSLIDSIKIVFIITSFIRPVGIFLLSSFLFGSTGGLISAIIFSLAPYQAVNSYVRGAIAENLALTILPFVFWSILKEKFFLFSIFVAAISLTHNLTLFYSLPIILLVILIRRQQIKKSLIHLILGLGISAFFIIPAFFEKKYTTVDTMTQGYFNYIIHFATIPQLFLNHNDWGFGASLWGPKDDMSFQIGYLQWLVPIVSIALAFITKNKKRFVYLFALLVATFFLFLTHNKSTFIWQHIPMLPFFQFPWRFLGPAVVLLSVISGLLFTIKNFSKYWLPTVMVVFVIEMILNFNFFKEDIWYSNLTDQQKLSGENLIAQSGAGLKDYWPKFGKNFPEKLAPSQPTITNNAKVINYQKTSQSVTVDVEVLSENSLVSFPLVYFPNFEAKDNGATISYLIDHDLGLVSVYLPQGNHHIKINFTNTILRFVANTISVVSLIILGLFYKYREK